MPSATSSVAKPTTLRELLGLSRSPKRPHGTLANFIRGFGANDDLVVPVSVFPEPYRKLVGSKGMSFSGSTLLTRGGRNLIKDHDWSGNIDGLLDFSDINSSVDIGSLKVRTANQLNAIAEALAAGKTVKASTSSVSTRAVSRGASTASVRPAAPAARVVVTASKPAVAAKPKAVAPKTSTQTAAPAKPVVSTGPMTAAQCRAEFGGDTSFADEAVRRGWSKREAHTEFGKRAAKRDRLAASGMSSSAMQGSRFFGQSATIGVVADVVGLCAQGMSYTPALQLVQARDPETYEAAMLEGRNDPQGHKAIWGRCHERCINVPRQGTERMSVEQQSAWVAAEQSRLGRDDQSGFFAECRRRVAESAGRLTLGKAIQQVARDRPDLHEKYLAQQRTVGTRTRDQMRGS